MVLALAAFAAWHANEARNESAAACASLNSMVQQAIRTVKDKSSGYSPTPA